MQVLIILSSLLSLSLAQGQSNQSGHWSNLQETFNNNGRNTRADAIYISIVENYRFEDVEQTNGKHLLVAISDSNNDMSCHLIEVGSEWEEHLLDDGLSQQVIMELFELITTHTALESELTWDELIQRYGDYDNVRNCIQHRVYELHYTPSFTTPRPRGDGNPYSQLLEEIMFVYS